VISTLDNANRYLDEVYIPFWNSRFAVQPAESQDAHRKLSKRSDLEALFAETCTRSVSNDFTIRFENCRWQVPKHQARGIRPRQKVSVERRLDGSMRFRFKKRYLDLELVHELLTPGPRNAPPLHARPKATRAPADPSKSKPRPPPAQPGPDHPWRKNGRLIANPRAIARHRAATAAAQPPPSAPHPERVP
jgi:hypothetical protein